MTDTVYFHTRQEEDTERLGRRLSAMFAPGTVITLDGDLGAGKTRFSQALARGMGVQEIVNSPTFTIIKEYEGARLPLYHMDVYRISLEEAEELGLDEYFFTVKALLLSNGLPLSKRCSPPSDWPSGSKIWEVPNANSRCRRTGNLTSVGAGS